jgi:hypothetical protein
MVDHRYQVIVCGFRCRERFAGSYSVGDGEIGLPVAIEVGGAEAPNSRCWEPGGRIATAGPERGPKVVTAFGRWCYGWAMCAHQARSDADCSRENDASALAGMTYLLTTVHPGRRARTMRSGGEEGRAR